MRTPSHRGFRGFVRTAVRACPALITASLFGWASAASAAPANPVLGFPGITDIGQLDLRASSNELILTSRRPVPNVFVEGDGSVALNAMTTDLDGQLIAYQPVLATFRNDSGEVGPQRFNALWLGDDALMITFQNSDRTLTTFRKQRVDGTTLWERQVTGVPNGVPRLGSAAVFANGDLFLVYSSGVSLASDERFEQRFLHYGRYSAATGDPIWEKEFLWSEVETFGQLTAYLITPGADDSIAMGVVDEPANQRHHLVEIDPTGEIVQNLQVSTLERPITKIVRADNGGIWFEIGAFDRISGVFPDGAGGSGPGFTIFEFFQDAVSYEALVSRPDGGLTIVGTTQGPGDAAPSNYSIVLDSTGTIVSGRKFTQLPAATFSDGVRLANGTYVFAGSSPVSGSPVLMYLDANGELLESNVGSCPASFAGHTALGEFGGSAYFLSNSARNWNSARQVAADAGGALASITSPGENEFLRTALAQSQTMAFIGLSDAASEGSFGWDSGESLGFTNFDANNSAENDFATMNFWAGSWSLDNVQVARPYLVEFPCNGSSNTTISLQCPADINFAATPGNPKAQISTFLNASTSCAAGGLSTSQTSGPANNAFVDPGLYRIAYSATDACGSEAVCDLTVSYPAWRSTLDVQCPEEIVLTTSSPTGAIVSWPDPTFSTDCPTGGEITQFFGPEPGSFLEPGSARVSYRIDDVNASAGCSNAGFCSFVVKLEVGDEPPTGECPANVPGYTKLGDLSGSSYYLSTAANNWPAARAAAVAAGGDLAAVTSSTENQSINGWLRTSNTMAFIGLNDAASEGAVAWSSGEAVSFPGFDAGNNSSDRDYAVINFWNGPWSFDSQQVQRKSVLELRCDGTTPTSSIDLQLSNLNGLQATAEPGDVVEFTFDLTNAGTDIAQNSFRVVMALSTDQSYQPGTDPIVGEVPTGNVGPGTIADITGAITVPASLADGSYRLILVADADNTVDETNENNNVLVSATTLAVSDGGPVGGSCPASLPGHSKIGEFGGHAYFLSDAKAPWTTKIQEAQSVGGYVTIVNGADENAFIKDNISESVWIGATDVNMENDFRWVNGFSVGFNQFTGSSGNSPTRHFVSMNFWDGNWTVESAGVWRRAFVEHDCD